MCPGVLSPSEEDEHEPEAQDPLPVSEEQFSAFMDSLFLLLPAWYRSSEDDLPQSHSTCPSR